MESFRLQRQTQIDPMISVGFRYLNDCVSCKCKGLDCTGGKAPSKSVRGCKASAHTSQPGVIHLQARLSQKAENIFVWLVGAGKLYHLG